MSTHFRRAGDGVRARLSVAELELLGQLPGELRSTYEHDSGPVWDRLFPRAYLDPTEEASEQEWEALVHPDLLAQRIATLDGFTATLARFQGSGTTREAVLVEDEPDLWLNLLNDVRLALGTRLGVSEELDLASIAPDDPDAGSYAIYGWLTWLQGELVEVLTE